MKKDPYLSKLDEQYDSGEITLIEKSNLYEKYVKEKNGSVYMENQDGSNLSENKQIINLLSKQNKILLEQQKTQKRISNNLLFFFWITIIFGFLLPISWVVFGLSLYSSLI
jgi:hypothetical protein